MGNPNVENPGENENPSENNPEDEGEGNGQVFIIMLGSMAGVTVLFSVFFVLLKPSGRRPPPMARGPPMIPPGGRITYTPRPPPGGRITYSPRYY